MSNQNLNFKYTSNTLGYKEENNFHKHKKSCISEYFKNPDMIELFGNEDPVGMQGELFRFKPGVDKNFI